MRQKPRAGAVSSQRMGLKEAHPLLVANAYSGHHLYESLFPASNRTSGKVSKCDHDGAVELLPLLGFLLVKLRVIVPPSRLLT